MKSHFAFAWNKTVWRIRHAAKAFGVPGMGAMLLFLTCALFLFVVLMPLQKQVQAIQSEALRFSARPKARIIQVVKSTPADELAQFYAFFPFEETIVDDMAKVYAAAAQQNLLLEQGEYRLAPERDSKLTRYGISLPVKGGYVQIRKFLAQALADVPNLALDSVTFGRQKADEAAINAQLQFTLYLRQP